MQAFPCGLRLKCWRTSTPSPPGCPAPSSRFQPRMKSSSESGCVLSLETAECPEPLCPWRALPAHGATSRVASEDITPPSSLIRAHASDQVPPGASVVPRTPGPCRLSPVPAVGWPFPTLSLQSLRRRVLVPVAVDSPRRYTGGDECDRREGVRQAWVRQLWKARPQHRGPRLVCDEVGPPAAVPLHSMRGNAQHEHGDRVPRSSLQSTGVRPGREPTSRGRQHFCDRPE